MNSNTYQYGDQYRAQKARIDFKQQLISLNMDMSLVSKEYPAEMVWAASWAAFRLNGFRYIKAYEQTKPDQIMNKVRMLRLLDGTEEITSDDIEIGRRMREHNTRYTMIALTRDLNNFECMVAEAVQLNTIKGRPQPHFSVIASLAMNYNRALKDKEAKNNVLRMIDGTHLSFEIGSTIELDNVLIIRSRMNIKHYKYFNIANYHNNMISWWGSQQLVENCMMNISGNVREYTNWESEHGPIKMTKLNYVRIIAHRPNT